ncbi:MAG: AAA family ATPase [Patescibacteria group bacterium]
MKLVILNGSTCSGKSTILKNIMKQQDNFFQLSYDSVKWLFSGYQASKHYQDVVNVLLAVTSTVLKMKYNIVTDSVLFNEYRQQLVALAKEVGCDILEINLEADFEVLATRFDERVTSALANPNSRISNTSKDRFKELFDIFNQEKNPEAITFRTDNQSVEEVTSSIMKLLV